MVMGPAWDRAKAHHMGCILPRKLPAVVATVCLLITLPGIALAHSNRATLIEVHVLKVSHDRATGTANCSNQPNNPGNGGFVLTGWQVQANVAASLNAATIPTNLNGNAVRTQLTNSFAAWKQAEAMAPGITVTGSTAITKATAMGLNMIIPHEDTYWNDPDNTSIAEADTVVYKTKIDFMAQHNIVVFRIHDHMHRQRPDFTFSGTAREVGLDPATETAPNSHRFVIPETTLGELAARVKKIRGDDAIRVVGDPNAKVRRIATGAGMATPAVNAVDVDVVIGGEQREIEGTFDSPEYVMDAATLGVPKGWIIIGHNMSEESGMQEMADWLRPIVPEVKVQHVRAGIVYWVPK